MKKAISIDKWIWMPHPGHLIVSFDCRFHLNTHIGKYIVSTVGEYFPGEGTREIIAKSRGIILEGIGDARKADYMKKIGFEDLGYQRKFETMVFKAKKAEDKCCPYRMASGSELDACGYMDAGEARAGHLRMCKKWARK